MQNSGQNTGSASAGSASVSGTKSTLAKGSRIAGQVTCEGDLVVDGQLEGGPLKVSGCLIVSADATVQCAEAEVGEALVIGLFQGSLRARDTVRIHQSGRVVGDILAPRVVFVSGPAVRGDDRPADRPAERPVERPQGPAQAPAQAPAPAREKRPTPPAAARPAAPVAAAPVAAAPVAAAPPVAAPAPGPRVIPALPSIGQRAMERKS
jgi:cytoskeletal protein CcmA (bactofilin family)